VHLKWAFSEAAVLFLRFCPQARPYLERLASKHGKGKALSILAAQLGRTVYAMLKHQTPFEQEKFLARVQSHISFGGDGEARRPTGKPMVTNTSTDRLLDLCLEHHRRSCVYRPLARRFDWNAVPLLAIFSFRWSAPYRSPHTTGASHHTT
jgi:hypothetical protein